MKKVDPPKIGHFRGGLLSSLLAKNPSKWLYYENFFTLVTSKMHFEPLRGFFGQKGRKQNAMANFGGVYFQSLDICMFRLNLTRHPSVPGSNKFFFLKCGFNLPNFMTLGGCPLKNLTFVQKLVS